MLDLSRQNPQLDLHMARVKYLAGKEYALPDKICDETVGGPVIKVIGRVPLLNFTAMHNADFIRNGKSLVLIMGY